MDVLLGLMKKYDLIAALTITAGVLMFSKYLAIKLKQEKMASAFAIIFALLCAGVVGHYTGGEKGVADIAALSGFGLLGGSMLRDYTIISTAYGVKMKDLKKAGKAGTVALLMGVVFSFVVGSIIAIAFGYTNPIDVATIAGGTCTFIVGPVTGGALGAGSDVIALSIASGVIKSVLAIIITPFVGDKVNLNNPTSAMIYGGLIGSTSGVAGGLASYNPKLVPYGAMVATFFTGLGSLLVPTVGFMLLKAVL